MDMPTMQLPLFLSKIDNADSKIKTDLQHFHRQPEGHPDKTYEFLYRAMKTHIERSRRKAFRDSQTSSRNGTVAMPAEMPGAAAPKAAAKRESRPRGAPPAGAGSRGNSPSNKLG
eukprot:9612630-Heterocapsa_arctica.AAC.1